MQFFLGSDKPIILFFLLINVKLPTIVGIFYIYKKKKNHAQLRWAWNKFYNLGARRHPITQMSHIQQYIHVYTVELQCLEHLWDYEIVFETWVVRAIENLLKSQVRRHNRDLLSIFFNMKVYCVFS